MTDADWTSCGEPMKLLRAVKFRSWRRPSRLFAVACGRLLWPLLVDDRSRRAVEVAERHADGGATVAELAAAYAAGVAAYRAVFAVAGKLGAGIEWAAAACADSNPFRAVTQVSASARAGRYLWSGGDAPTLVPCAVRRRTGLSALFGRWEVVRLAEPELSAAGWAQQAALVRCIFTARGRPATFDPSWRTEPAVALARGMYESRDFTIAPILADALDDAGCHDARVLGHLRGGGVHVRGCWVVDGVLGLE